MSRVTGRSIFTNRELAQSLMVRESKRSAEKTIAMAVRRGLLFRMCRGLYGYQYARVRGGAILEESVLQLRPRAFNYISLESALSTWGVIDQVNLGALSVMSSGRSGRFETPCGLILITHTARSAEGLKDGLVPPQPPESWLPCAKPTVAARDLMRVGRNTDLIEWDEIPIAEREIAT